MGLNEKINLVIKSINDKINYLNNKLSNYYNKKIENNNKEEYLLELERKNFHILKINNQLKRCQLFINRCILYQEYLKKIENKNILDIKKLEYALIKNIQEELIFYYDSTISELNQKNIIEKICMFDQNSLIQKEIIKKERDKQYKLISNNDFKFDLSKIYSTQYLDFNIENIVNNLYKKEQKDEVQDRRNRM